ncbi:MAG TPA: ABC transporter ATP-binding protein [Solirubrobacteraceae bacterium]|nr:ABC transporter ATP-binding protein [Solirubrobacteraceae bacterium]
MTTLELHNVVKRYQGAGEAISAVDGVSLRIGPGEFVALYGPSGSGKTTLLSMAAAIMRPDDGEVCFDGRRVSDLSESESARYRRENVGMVSQSFNLLGGATALDNASLKLLPLGLTFRQAHRKALPWLERVGLGARAKHTPGEMSMGERQRVAIAKALANTPRLLLADEPTGNLDSQRSREILGMLAEISHEHKLPALLVTHDPQATAFVDRTYTLRDGRLSNGLDVELLPTVHQ